MKKGFVKAISLSISILLLASFFTGCGTQKEVTNTTAATQGTTAASSEASTTSSQPVYPMKTNVTLKYWVSLNGNLTNSVKNLGETAFAKELEKRTGIKVEYVHPPQGQEKEVFNLMLASGNLPDIIEYDINASFNGGAENAIQSGYILRLNEIIDQYAPNYSKVLADNPQLVKIMKTDSGNIYSFAYIRDTEDPSLQISTFGPMVRRDWLDDLGLALPETIDDWENMLRAFKEKKGATIPLTLSGSGTGLGGVVYDPGTFISPFVPTREMYHDGDKIKYGAYEDGFNEGLALLNRWYNEGLLDKNVFTTDDKIREANMLNGKSGATVAYIGAHMVKWINAMKDQDPKFDLVGVKFPVANKGDKPRFGSYSGLINTSVAHITATSNNVEAAARLLDYGYSEEGRMLMTFGIENESYTMVDGKPVLTDLITKNPEKLSFTQAISKFARSAYPGPYMSNRHYVEQSNTMPQQNEALKNFSFSDAANYKLFGLSATSEEATRVAKIQSDVHTYVNEMSTKFIMGSESLADFGKYKEQLKQMGVEELISLYQAQYDRFLKR